MVDGPVSLHQWRLIHDRAPAPTIQARGGVAGMIGYAWRLINEPGGDEYYGGQVAGPVFANVMAGALRLLNIAPDALPPAAHYAQANTVAPAQVQAGGQL